VTVVQFPGHKRGVGFSSQARPPDDPPPGSPFEVEVRLPTFHTDQVNAFLKPGRFRAGRCGRRWGKTTFDEALACDHVIKGASVGWFAPNYKYLIEPMRDMEDILAPIILESNKSMGFIHTRTKGNIDFWTMEDIRAGRGRHYHLVIIDEAAFAKDNAMEVWERSIRPTLVDHRGAAIVTSNTNGVVPGQFFWRICNEPKHGFVEFHAPSRNNPFLPQEELDELQRKAHPLVWLQEYEAEFVDWRGVAFFALDKLLVNGEPVEYPQICDTVFATVDTAIKSGSEHDGTAIIYWALLNVPEPHLVILDWDIVQIDGALLVEWLPNAFRQLEAFTHMFRVRFGYGAIFIEDKGSGSILLQAGEARGWPVVAIDSALTAKGKDERAMAVSGFHYNGWCKISRQAYDRVLLFKEQELNHLVTQVTTFRIGDKEGYKRADDLLDTYTYGLSIGLGGGLGF
jgi:hypothetical protein